MFCDLYFSQLFRRPAPYNEFLRELKPEILSTSHLSRTFWQKLVDQDLSLIDQDLERNSDVTTEEALEFAKVETDANADESKTGADQDADVTDDDMVNTKFPNIELCIRGHS